MLTNLFNGFKKRKIDLKKINKILVIATNGIGDLIMCIPLLEQLRELFPFANITLMCKSENERQVVDDSGLVNNFIYYSQIERNNYIKKFNIIKEIYKKNYDLSITTTTVNMFKSMLLTYLARIPYRIGDTRNLNKTLYNFPIPISNCHYILRNLKLLEPLGVKHTIKKPIIKSIDVILPKKYKYSKNKLNIGFHFGSGERDKNKRWPIDNYITLINIIKEELPFIGIYIFGSNIDSMLSKKLFEKINDLKNIYDFTGKLTLKQTMTLIKRCKVIVGGDTGIVHLAAALKCNIVCFFGPTDPTKTKPIGENIIILKKDLPCMPCYGTDMFYKCRHTRCMNSITVQDAYNSIKNF
jgi:heptosyltransferase II